ncbi:MAG: alpha/beta fold hydrolase, partial [Acidiferrobacteraceae bacterium]|nr:alpha/beta fold hydrolase [Acidiferrobacteraceae bacterium]
MSEATQSRTVQIDGDLLECQWQAPDGSAPTLVYLHEGLGCVRMWRDFPCHLAAQTGLGLLNYSRSGYGGSSAAVLPRQADYMHHEAMVVLPQVLEAFDIRSAVLVGHSDGGSIAIIHAGSERADRVKGLILMAPHVFVEPLSIESIRQAAKLYRTTDLPEKLSRYHSPCVDSTFW